MTKLHLLCTCLSIISVVACFSGPPLDVSTSCLDCICHATSGCTNSTSCFQDDQGQVYCGILLLQEKHWQEALHLHRLYVRPTFSTNHRAGLYSSATRDHLQTLLERVFAGQPLDVLGKSFDQCYSNRLCSELVLRTIAVTHLADCDGDHMLTCKDAALLHQLGVDGCGALRAHALGRRGRTTGRRPSRLMASNTMADNKRVSFALEYLRVLSTHRCISQLLYTTAATNSTLNASESAFQSGKPMVNPDPPSHNSPVSVVTSSPTLVSPSKLESTSELPTKLNHLEPIMSSSTLRFNSSDSPLVRISAACFRCIRSASSNNTNAHCNHPLQKCGNYAITFQYYLNANGEQLVKQQYPHMVSNETASDIKVDALYELSPLHAELANWNETQLLHTWLQLVQRYQSNLATIKNDMNSARAVDKRPGGPAWESSRTNYNNELSKLLPPIEAKDQTNDTRGFEDAEPEEDKTLSQPRSRRNSRAFMSPFSSSQPLSSWTHRRTHRMIRSTPVHPLAGKSVQLRRQPRQSKVLRLGSTARQLMSRNNVSDFNFDLESEEGKVLLEFVIRSKAFRRYQLCVQSESCAQQLIQQYVIANSIDCNLDRVIDCDDFAGIHWFGHDCRQTTLLYSNFWKSFEYCSILADDARREPSDNVDISAVGAVNSNSTNDTNAMLGGTWLPPFVIRPSVTGHGSLNGTYNTDVPSEGSFFDKLPVEQYYANHVIELSVDCLQCICEASSSTFNCTEAANPQTPSSFYFSAYKMSADTPPPPPPPQPIFFKLQRQQNSPVHRLHITHKKSQDKPNEPLYFRYVNNGQFEMTDDARIEYKALNEHRPAISTRRRPPTPFARMRRSADSPSADASSADSPLTDVHEILEICPNEKVGCGPFGLTKRYWIDAGVPMHRGAANDFDRCAYSPECSAGAVAKYVSRYSADCTKDGRLSCADFGLIHKFKDKCADLSVLNSDYYRRFEKCLTKLGLH